MIINEDGSITIEESDKQKGQQPRWRHRFDSDIKFHYQYGNFDIYKGRRGGAIRDRYIRLGMDGSYHYWYDTIEACLNACITGEPGDYQ